MDDSNSKSPKDKSKKLGARRLSSSELGTSMVRRVSEMDLSPSFNVTKIEQCIQTEAVHPSEFALSLQKKLDEMRQKVYFTGSFQYLFFFLSFLKCLSFISKINSSVNSPWKSFLAC